MAGYKVNFEEVPWESPMVGFRFKATKGNGKQMRLVEYAKHMEPHWCEKGHMGYVLDGQLEVIFDGQKVVYDKGDGLVIPNGEEHRHMARILSQKAILIMYDIV